MVSDGLATWEIAANMHDLTLLTQSGCVTRALLQVYSVLHAGWAG
jgi:hypothetical protein